MGETKGEQLSTEESPRETAGWAAFYEAAEARPRWMGGQELTAGQLSKVGGGVLCLGSLAVASSCVSSACDSAGTSYGY